MPPKPAAPLPMTPTLAAQFRPSHVGTRSLSAPKRIKPGRRFHFRWPLHGAPPSPGTNRSTTPPTSHSPPRPEAGPRRSTTLSAATQGGPAHLADAGSPEHRNTGTELNEVAHAGERPLRDDDTHHSPDTDARAAGPTTRPTRQPRRRPVRAPVESDIGQRCRRLPADAVRRSAQTVRPPDRSGLPAVWTQHPRGLRQGLRVRIQLLGQSAAVSPSSFLATARDAA